MESDSPNGDRRASNGQTDRADPRHRLMQVRATLLDLHKALLDSERTAYEVTHGAIASKAAYLQMLIGDSRFAWLKPVTTMLVQIDEGLAAKRPPREDWQLEQLINDTRALLTPSREGDEFWNRYRSVVERDPGVAVLHERLESDLLNQ